MPEKLIKKSITFTTEDQLMSTRLEAGAAVVPADGELSNPFYNDHASLGDILKTDMKPAVFFENLEEHGIHKAHVAHSIIREVGLFAGNAPFKIVDEKLREIKLNRESSWNMNDAIMIGGKYDVRPLPGVADRLFQRHFLKYAMNLKMKSMYIPNMAFITMSDISGVGAAEVFGSSGTDYEDSVYVGGIEGAIMFNSYIEITIDYYMRNFE
jgi:hypothetical protein